MISSTEKKLEHPKELEEKYPQYKHPLSLLESKEVRTRMKGYALFTVKFTQCPVEIREYVRQKWSQEKNVKRIKKAFLKHCENIFTPKGV